MTSSGGFSDPIQFLPDRFAQLFERHGFAEASAGAESLRQFFEEAEIIGGFQTPSAGYNQFRLRQIDFSPGGFFGFYDGSL